jgi:hypothetical protein
VQARHLPKSRQRTDSDAAGCGGGFGARRVEEGCASSSLCVSFTSSQ